ncbi:unnamed protein product [Haemonchus placei]|uniref:ZP domain-containing protein n=1 Tax=Haemonchus placei TaxID=6290 RepID=A0A158QNQ5_HAEPC|nr:unnamed protein product [Haemonchus placei]
MPPEKAQTNKKAQTRWIEDGMLIALLFMAVLNRVASLTALYRHTPIRRDSVYHPDTVSGPCTFPVPYTKEFDIFCQLDYHKTTYICDPAGVLSRTEIEMLDHTVHLLNMTSCFCSSTCGRGRKKLGIVIVPAASISSIISCDSSLDFAPPTSLPAAAYLFAQLLSRHWSTHCTADLMIVYIRSWNPDRIRKPFIVPVYSNALERLQRYSHPTSVSSREPVLVALQAAIRHANRLIEAEWTDMNTSIPHWAMGLACGMVAIVILSVYTANCITNRLDRPQKQRSAVAGVRKNSDRFRAGFGGGMMMNASAQQKRSVMMFRTFSKTPARNGASNRL